MANPENKNVVMISKDNGIFIIFNDYEDEASFASFLELLVDRLGAEVQQASQYPYSLVSELTVEGKKITAMWRSDIGCFIRVDLVLENLAKEIKKTFS
jgi:hypothetical protein